MYPSESIRQRNTGAAGITRAFLASPPADFDTRCRMARVRGLFALRGSACDNNGDCALPTGGCRFWRNL